MKSTRSQDGAFRPSELGLFSRVMERLKSKDLGDASQQELAQRVMANYMAGLTDEDELVEASRRPLGR